MGTRVRRLHPIPLSEDGEIITTHNVKLIHRIITRLSSDAHTDRWSESTLSWKGI